MSDDLQRDVAVDSSPEPNGGSHAAAVSASVTPGTSDLAILAHHAELLHSLAPGIIHQLASARQGLLAARTSPKALEEVARRLDKAQSVISTLTGELWAFDHTRAVGTVTRVERVLAEVELWQSCQITLPKVRVNFEPYPPMPDARIRPEHLRDVLAAILTNAKEAMADRPDGEIRVKAISRSAWIVITVTDEGSGFAREALERLFEPFNTTKDPNRHLGLGLAVARQLLRNTGGEIHILPPEGRAGTAVELMIPISDAGGPTGRADPR